LGSGATFAEVSKTQVAGFEIAVPRLGEQRKIAANLYGQLAAAARARAAVEAQLDGALRIEVALLEEFFPADQNTHEQPLEDMLAAPLRTGLSKPMLPASEFRCLTLSSVRNGALDFSASKPVDVTKAEAEANRVKPGAFYVVRGNGNRELVGRGALAPAGTETPMTFPDLLFELVPDARRLLPDFLRWAWNAPGVRRQIEAKAQTSAGIYKINQGNLRQIRVPVPPLDEQVRLVHELQDRSAATRRLIGALQEKRDALDSLPARLLASAFGAAPTHHGQEN
jgi:type I restriction enzyme S subunit